MENLDIYNPVCSTWLIFSGSHQEVSIYTTADSLVICCMLNVSLKAHSLLWISEKFTHYVCNVL